MGPGFSDNRRVYGAPSNQIEQSLRRDAQSLLEQSIRAGKDGVPQYPPAEILVYGLDGPALTFFNDAYGAKFSIKIVDKIPENGPGVNQVLIVDKTKEAELHQAGEAFEQRSGLCFNKTLLYRPPQIGATCGGTLSASGEISQGELNLLEAHLKCPFIDHAGLAVESLELWRREGAAIAIGSKSDLTRSLLDNLDGLPFRDNLGLLTKQQVKQLIQTDAVFRETFLEAAWLSVAMGF